MKMELSSLQTNKTTLALRQLELERQALLTEGYRFIGSCSMLGVLTYVMRNPNNHNRIILRQRGATVEIMKNGQLVKTITI